MRSLQATTLLALAPLAISTSSTKRGLCHVPSQKHPTDDNIWTTVPGSDLTWYYNYQPTPSQAFESDNSLEFIPMLWGASDNDVGTPFLDAVRSRISSGKNVTYVLGFNEPDGSSSTGGSGIPVDLAASTWIKQIEPLKKMGVKLGAPAVTGSPNGFVWLKNFFQQCNGSCNPDFIPVHWYGNFEGMASHIGEVIGTFPNISKVWVTEWGFPNQPLAATQSFYNMSTEYFDRMDNITHYSYFGAFRSDVSNVGPNAAMLTEQGKLTDIGSWYMGGVATNNIPKAGDAALVARFAGWGLVVVATGVWTML